METRKRKGPGQAEPAGKIRGVESNQVKIGAFKEYIDGTRDLDITFTYQGTFGGLDKWSINIFMGSLSAAGIGHPTNYPYDIKDFLMNDSGFQTMMVSPTHPRMTGTQIPFQSIVGNIENAQQNMSWFPGVTNYLQFLRILLVYYIVYAVAINYIIDKASATNKKKASEFSKIYNDILKPVFSSLDLSLTKDQDKTIYLEQNKINELIVYLLKQIKLKPGNERIKEHLYSQIITEIVTNLENQSEIYVENTTTNIKVGYIIGAVENMKFPGMQQSGGSRKKKRSKKRNKQRSKQKKKLKRKIMSKKRRR